MDLGQERSGTYQNGFDLRLGDAGADDREATPRGLRRRHATQPSRPSRGRRVRQGPAPQSPARAAAGRGRAQRRPRGRATPSLRSPLPHRNGAAREGPPAAGARIGRPGNWRGSDPTPTRLSRHEGRRRPSVRARTPRGPALVRTRRRWRWRAPIPSPARWQRSRGRGRRSLGPRPRGQPRCGRGCGRRRW